VLAGVPRPNPLAIFERSRDSIQIPPDGIGGSTAVALGRDATIDTRYDGSKVKRFGLFFFAVFLGAFLVFVIQPVVGRLLLPRFGGAPAVWTTCLVFFQCALFLGYLWAHLIVSRGGTRMQVWAHTAVLALAAMTLPIAHNDLPHADVGSGSSLAVLWWLTLRVSPSFIVLSATAPLLQRWYAVSTGAAAHPLYAISNVGSMLALLVYPVGIEPWLSVQQQCGLFRHGFVVFAGMVAWSGFRTLRHPVVVFERPIAATIAQSTHWMWIGLSALPSLLLVAITHHLTLDVAGGPLLWVLPLATYLVSFILVFGQLGNRGRSLWLLGWIVATVAMGANLFLFARATFYAQLGASLAVLFFGAMLCHGELVRRRPGFADNSRFMLFIAAGGALGSLAAGILAPLVFGGFFELQLGIIGIFGLLLIAIRTRGVAGEVRTTRRLLWLGFGAAVPVLLATVWIQSARTVRDATVLERKRNFFGLVQATRFPTFTVMTHGRIRHGLQWNDSARRGEPTLYFGRETAIGTVLSSLRSPKHVGVLGLGVGTLAAYGNAGDRFQFYEIDRDVVRMAQQQFSFLREARAQVDLQVGDGRMLLARQPGQHFDVLVLDAFSSDSVPVHLLTVEAFALYRSHLGENGLLLANVSNRHLAIERAVLGSAEAHGLFHRLCETARTDGVASGAPPRPSNVLVRWMLVSPSDAMLAPFDGRCRRVDEPGVRWYDDKSSVLSILR